MLSLTRFKEEMQKLKTLFEKDDKFDAVLRELSYDGYGFIFGEPISQIIGLLEEIMEDVPRDDHDESWIEYYVYDLEFGEKWKPGSVTKGVICGPETQFIPKDEPYKFAEGEVDVPLKTVEDLYNLLHENWEEKHCDRQG